MRCLCGFTCPGSFWDPQSSQTLVLGSPSNPVTKMVPVGGKLWCGSQNRVLVINTATLAQEVRTETTQWCKDLIGSPSLLLPL